MTAALSKYACNRTGSPCSPVAAKYPDYYPQLPGALAGGRTLDPELFDTSLLGEELPNLRKPSPSTLLMGRIAWTARDAHKAMARGFGWQ